MYFPILLWWRQSVPLLKKKTHAAIDAERDRAIERERDSESDGEREGEIERQTDRETDRQTETETAMYIDIDRQTEKQKFQINRPSPNVLK